MSNLFDEFAYSQDEPEEEVEESSSDVISQAVVASLNDDEIDDELSEAERRLSKAAYYRALVRDGLFSEDNSEHAAEINVEARLWARQQMSKLLGLNSSATEPVKVESQFSDAEVGALKRLAAYALAKIGETPSNPVVKKMESPPTPQIRKVQVQAPKQAKPVAKAQPKPAPKLVPVKTKTPKIQKDADGEPNYDNQPSGEIFQDVDGHSYKMVDNANYDPDNEASRPRFKRRVNGQVKAGLQRPIPMPSQHQQQAISAQQAQESVDVTLRGNGLLTQAANKILNS